MLPHFSVLLVLKVSLLDTKISWFLHKILSRFVLTQLIVKGILLSSVVIGLLLSSRANLINVKLVNELINALSPYLTSSLISILLQTVDDHA